MQVIAIRKIEEFDNLKNNWTAVYSADPHAPVFASWAWFRGWIENSPYDWLTLACKTDTSSSFVAFMVVGLEPVENKKNDITYCLHMGGNPFADHTGFVCLPEYVEEAIPAFTTFLKRELKWNEFILNSVFDPRLDTFLGCFSEKRFIVQENERIFCPYIALPKTSDQYLQEYLSKKTRKEILTKTKKLKLLNEFHVTQAQGGNIDSHIDTLLTLWKSRWAFNSDDMLFGVKIEDVLNIFRSVFRSCFKNNHFWLHIFWYGDTPIAGKAAFYDKQKQYFLTNTAAVNYEFAKHSPGMVMNVYQIRYAIENGFRIFDFGSGNEEYKFKLGAKERFTRSITIRQMSLTAAIRNRIRIRTRLRNVYSRLQRTADLIH